MNTTITIFAIIGAVSVLRGIVRFWRELRSLRGGPTLMSGPGGAGVRVVSGRPRKKTR